MSAILSSGSGLRAWARAELVDAVGKDRDHLLPALAFRGRNPGVFKAAFVNAQYGQNCLSTSCGGRKSCPQSIVQSRGRQPETSTPSAPLSSALTMNSGSIRPEQGTRMTRRSVGWVARATPAVSAPAIRTPVAEKLTILSSCCSVTA